MKAIYIYTDDWLSSTDVAAMTASQERGFFRVLMHQAKQKDGRLPASSEVLGRLSLLGTKGWNNFRSQFPNLFVEENGKLWNPKQLKGWEKHNARSESGLKGAQTRWQNDSKLDSKDDSKQDARLKDLKTYRPNISEDQERKRSSFVPPEVARDRWRELLAWWESQRGGWRSKDLAAQVFVSRDWDEPDKFAAVRATLPVWEEAFKTGFPPGHLENWIRDWTPDAKPFTKQAEKEKPKLLRPIGRRA